MIKECYGKVYSTKVYSTKFYSTKVYSTKVYSTYHDFTALPTLPDCGVR
jgi:hypothetical protein